MYSGLHLINCTCPGENLFPPLLYKNFPNAIIYLFGGVLSVSLEAGRHSCKLQISREKAHDTEGQGLNGPASCNSKETGPPTNLPTDAGQLLGVDPTCK